MGKNLSVLLLLAFSLISCCNSAKEITYTFGKAVIKRVDKCNRTIFYYAKIDKYSPVIWVEYSGINDGFSGYLIFQNNGKVNLLSGDGYFQTSNVDTVRFEYKRIAAFQRPELGENVYFVELATKFELEKNRNTGTKVKAVYDDIVNEK
jgi:hypothetical protein